MKPIFVTPDRYAFLKPQAKAFYLIAPPGLADTFALAEHTGYAEAGILTSSASRAEDAIQSLLPDDVDVLAVFLSDTIPVSIGRATEGTRRRIFALPVGLPADGTDIHYLHRLFEEIGHIDPELTETAIRPIRAAVHRAGALQVQDTVRGATATVRLRPDVLEWHDNAGPAPRGTVRHPFAASFTLRAPEKSSEIRDPMSGASSRRLVPDAVPIFGRLVLGGTPVVQAAQPDGAADRYYTRLASMNRHPLVVTVLDGTITDESLRSPLAAAHPIAEALTELFEQDGRYRRISALTFNPASTIRRFPGNRGLNRCYGGRQGAIGITLGEIPHTPLSVSVISTTVQVLDDEDRLLLGGNGGSSCAVPRRLNRVSSPGCGCH